MFILYLATALEPKRTEIHKEHNYSKHPEASIAREDLEISQLEDHCYYKTQNVDKTLYLQDQQCAEDIGWITNKRRLLNKIEKKIPKALRDSGLLVNESKTEEFIIEGNGGPKWKTCKYLGSLLDTESDFKRRKRLAMSANMKCETTLRNR